MTENIDELISESQAIRDDLNKTIGRLEAFCISLTDAAEALRTEVAPNAGNSQTGIGETDAPS
jgi:hypothetical protein